MEKYKGYLGELEYLIDKEVITEEHPYYNLYEYIIQTNREKLVKRKIKETLLIEIDRLKELFFKEAKEDSIEIETKMLPWLYEAYKRIIAQDYSRIQALIILLEQNNFSEFINNIYTEVTSTADEEKKHSAIEKSYTKILEKCNMALRGIKYKNKPFVIENEDRIDKEIISQFYETLTEKEILAINIVKNEEETKSKLTVECNEIYKIIKDKEKITCKQILEITNNNIEKLDKQILEMLKKDNKMYEYLAKENIVENYNNQTTINITMNRLNELKISGELFEKLNVRCRLQIVENIIKDILKESQIEITLSQEDKKTLEKIIENKDLEEIEPRYISTKIIEIIEEFKNLKEKQFNNKSKELADIMHNQELYKTELLKKIEQDPENNIYLLYQPTPLGITSRGNAIYMINVLKKLSEDQEQLDSFLENQSVKILTPAEENIIENIVRERLIEYIDNNKVTPTEENEKQLRLILKENENAK